MQKKSFYLTDSDVANIHLEWLAPFMSSMGVSIEEQGNMADFVNRPVWMDEGSK